MMNRARAMSWEIEPLLNSSKVARAFSPTNIALAKYWGKRDTGLNLPTNSSLSATLKSYGSFTTVEFDSSFKMDRLILNGKEEPIEKIGKIIRVLDDLRGLAGFGARARVQTMNNFPTAAGLASSASGLSALTFAGANALELSLETKKLSEIARKGSGSACRSFFSGFVEWKKGEKADGSDSVAEQVATVAHWPLHAMITIVNRAQKTHASTGGMESTRTTSPFFDAWVESAQAQVGLIRNAIDLRDFNALASLAESNCIRMHASAMAAQPPIFYWQPSTLEIMQKVVGMRKQGIPVFFTIDAGPNVVVFCEPSVSSQVHRELSQLSGVQIMRTEVGEGTRSFNLQEFSGEP